MFLQVSLLLLLLENYFLFCMNFVIFLILLVYYIINVYFHPFGFLNIIFISIQVYMLLPNDLSNKISNLPNCTLLYACTSQILIGWTVNVCILQPANLYIVYKWIRKMIMLIWNRHQIINFLERKFKSFHSIWDWELISKFISMRIDLL